MKQVSLFSYKKISDFENEINKFLSNLGSDYNVEFHYSCTSGTFECLIVYERKEKKEV